MELNNSSDLMALVGEILRERPDAGLMMLDDAREIVTDWVQDDEEREAQLSLIEGAYEALLELPEYDGVVE